MAGPYAYSNNGLSFRLVDAKYSAQDGEVVFASQASSGQLATAFTGYTAAAAVQARAAFVALAQEQLDLSDTTMHRISEAVALGLTTWTASDVVTWVDWRRSLRAIVSGSDASTNSLPLRPSYPTGT